MADYIGRNANGFVTRIRIDGLAMSVGELEQRLNETANAISEAIQRPWARGENVFELLPSRADYKGRLIMLIDLADAEITRAVEVDTYN